MFQIKNLFSIAVIVFGLTVCFSMDAQAQAIPPGSYQQSCTDIKIVNQTTLQADCLTKEEGAPETTTQKILGGGKPFTSSHPTTIPDYFVCNGDISNDDGKLTCQQDMNSPQMNAARKAIDFGVTHILGLKVSNEESFLGAKLPSDKEYFMWIRQMFKSGMDATFYKGWTPVVVQTFFNHYLAAPERGGLRASVINNAFKEVYGSESLPDRQAFWDAKIKSGDSNYSSIVVAETKIQNSNPVSRKLMILKTYKDAMGRAPTAAETTYWFTQTGSYKQTIEAHRSWLYSPQGASELTETVKRALTGKYGKKSVSDIDVKNALSKYAKDKKIYDEM